MKNEVKTISPGQAFQLSAAFIQSLSKLNLPADIAQMFLSNTRKRDQLVRQMLEPRVKIKAETKTDRVPRKPITFEHINAHICTSPHITEEVAGILDLVSLGRHPGDIQPIKKGENWPHTFAGDKGNPVLCMVEGERPFVALAREFLEHDGSDLAITDIMEKRRVFWTIPQILELIQRCIDEDKDPVGLSDYTSSDRPLYIPVVYQRSVFDANDLSNNQDFLGGLVQLWKKKFRETGKWHISTPDLTRYFSYDPPMFPRHGAKEGHILFLNDPRVKGDK